MVGRPEQIGRYELRGQVGVGGFATVYRAYDPELDRQVALKVLHPHLSNDADVRARFLREGRALARVRHPNIVQVHDAGQFDGLAFLAMELVEGESLDRLLNRTGPLSLDRVLPIVEQVAAALDAVHAQGLIHRDVKPVNIILEERTGRAVLLDLGVVRAIDAVNTTGTGAVLGTPGFMAPEQLLTGAQITPQTDVYQFGATVHALLSGRPPFSGDPVMLFHAIVNTEPDSLHALRPDLPPAVAATVMEALAKDPTRRPPGTRAFAERLRSASAAATDLTSARTMIAAAPPHSRTQRLPSPPAPVLLAPAPARTSARRSRSLLPWVLAGMAAALAAIGLFAVVLTRGTDTGTDTIRQGGAVTPLAGAPAQTDAATVAPTAAPPTSQATAPPTATPTTAPTQTPTATATATPTPAPTAEPTQPPTPTRQPTATQPPPTAAAPANQAVVPIGTARRILAGIMEQRGYTPDGEVIQVPATGRGRSLSVQRGICNGSANGACQIAFILLDDRFLGTDTANPSAGIISYAPVDTNQFTITYANYAQGDPACCPSLAPVTVVYTWNGNRLTPNRTPPGH